MTSLPVYKLCFECNWDRTYLRFYAGKTEGGRAYWLLDAITHARMTHQPQLHGRHCLTNFIIAKRFLSKRTETSFHKKIPKKRNLACVRMAQYKNACTG